MRVAAPADQPVRAEQAAAAPGQVSKTQAARAYGKLPLAFVPNAGQLDPRVRYSAQRAGMGVFFTRREAVVALAKNEQSEVLGLRFLGASPKAIEGRRQGAGKVNYLLGNDPKKWHTGLPTYRQVVYRDLWHGVDMSFLDGKTRLEYEFVVRPGARVSDLHLAYRGVSGLSLDANGNLRLPTRLGALTDVRPRSFQLVDGRRIPVASHFTLRGDGTFGFAVGSYDQSRALVIDPGLVYSTFVGGSASDIGNAAVDTAGSAYVTGSTLSANFPTTPGAFDTSYGDAGNTDAFVTKLNASGSALVYSTFLGGSTTDVGNAIAVDSTGAAYVTGSTGGSFPIQNDPASGLPIPWQPTYAGGTSDAFVTKLNAAGTGLVFSTYAGGGGADQGWGIAVHSSGDVYVVGDTTSTNFPHTASALQATRSGNSDAFFLRLDRFAAGAGYSSYVGGNADDSARGIAIDSNRNVFLTGLTTSTNFSTAGVFQGTYGTNQDAFVRRLNLVSSVGGNDTYSTAYSTYLGGSLLEQGFGIAIDSADNAYAAGLTRSTNYPVTAGTMARGGGTDEAFVTKLGPNGGAAPYSTYLGGSGDDRIQAIALDAAGAAHVVGWTSSSNFPTTPGAFDTTFNGGRDAFVTKLNLTGTGLLYSTFLGGSTGSAGNNDQGMGIALDASGNAYVTGLANSSDFPTTPGAFDTSQNGSADVFVTKLDMVGAPYKVTLSPLTDTNPVGASHTVTATVTDFGGRPVAGATVTFTVTGANPQTGTGTTNASGQATFTYTGTAAGQDTITASNSTAGTSAPVTKNWADDTVTTVVRDSSGNDVTNTIVGGGVVVHDEATVTKTPSTPAVVPNPTGTVDFTLYDNATCDGVVVATDPGEPLDSNGTATSAPFTIPATVGAYSYLAHYNGDANYPPHYGPCEPFNFDGVPPVTTITLDPAQPDCCGWYVFAVMPTVSATDVGSGVLETRCVLDPATVPLTFDDLPPGMCPYLAPSSWVLTEGVHTLYAGSIDNAGNKEYPLVNVVFKIDKTPPTSQVDPLPQFQPNPGAFTVSWSGQDNLSGIKDFDVRYRTAPAGGSFGSYTQWFTDTTLTSASFTPTPGSTVCFSVRARDRACWESPTYSPEVCTTAPYDDPSLARMGYWSTVTGTGYFGPSVSRSTTIGSKLTLTGLRASVVGVLATKQPGGGTIELRWNGFTKATVNLSAATVQKKQLLTFTLPSVQTGTLDIVQTGYGTVDIDAAGAWKAS